MAGLAPDFRGHLLQETDGQLHLELLEKLAARGCYPAEQIANLTIPSHIDVFETNGYDAETPRGRASYRRVASPPDHPGFQVDELGAIWDLAERTVRPEMFGARGGDPTFDDFNGLAEFFGYLERNTDVHGDMRGHWHTSQPLNLIGALGSTFTMGRITATAAMTDPLLTVTGAQMHLGGYLALEGRSPGGFATYGNRECRAALAVSGAGQSTFDRIFARGFQRWAVESVGGQNNNIRIGSLQALDCGSNGGASAASTQEVAFVNRVDNAIIGPNQKSTFTLAAAVPTEWKVHDILIIEGEPCQILSISGVTIEVFPTPPNNGDGTINTSGTAVAVHGGGLSVEANDSGLWQINGISALRCGMALRHGSLYGLECGLIHSEFNGAGLQIGLTRTGSGRGLVLGNVYFEGPTDLQVLHSGGIEVDASIEATNDLKDFSRWKKLNQRAADNTLVDPVFWGVTLNFNGGTYQPEQGTNLDEATGGTGATVTRTNEANRNTYAFDRGSGTIELEWLADAFRIFGGSNRSVYIELNGPGSDQNPNGNITIRAIDAQRNDPTNPITVEGQAEFTFSSDRSANIRATFFPDTNDWSITYLPNVDVPAAI
ncbi:MAG: hypothetical protein AAF415_02250 [Pseudomonadota bacterium]